MIKVRTHEHRITEIQLDRPPVNALDLDLVNAMTSAIGAAIEQGAEALIFSGRSGLFSAGLDVPALLELDQAGMRRFWDALFGLLKTIADSEVPIVVALTGHSPAGGTVIALFADYRIQADGDFQLGLNEVQVGLVVPPVIHAALVRLIGAYRAERHLVAGRMISPAEALSIGLVDELAPPEEVVRRALAWCRGLLELPRHSMSGTRRLCRRPLVELFNPPGGLDVDSFVQGWFASETQATLRALVARLKAGGR